ncbi:short-chain dehydrogenase [Roseovarius sp. TE539]|uniref:NnrS family protein n=1 Tax=Roseovarius sp. TE539 TaxID=2249812 RepID=UPI000DDE299A|nr:NnrS family protein [Roseovarius sp. TE539]RBI70308.1 short-chain dehydrogenase [Roseovarius sp. TE539]
MSANAEYSGPAVFSHGFRPFFLAAVLFGLAVIPVWLAVWRGAMGLGGPFLPVDWHVHEMIFGYGAAVLAGFLFTAVPNWTGRMPVRGWPLAVLLALWVAGRLAVAGLLWLGPVGAMLFDSAFLLAVVGMVTREIIAGKNWRNLKVAIPVALLLAANVLFHVEAMTGGMADTGRRFGTAALIFLVMLIGGRIVPSFTRNWLTKQGATRMPVPFNRFDVACLVAGAAAMLAWTVVPDSSFAGGLFGLSAVLHGLRLARWRGVATWRSPLLVMLHLAYGFLPVGLLAASLAAVGLAGPQAGAHLLGIGAVGGMTVAVMMRATIGHTGRPLVAGRTLATAFAMVAVAAAVRAAGATGFGPVPDGITLAALLWTAGFLLLALRLAPWLAAPGVTRRRPNRVT